MDIAEITFSVDVSSKGYKDDKGTPLENAKAHAAVSNKDHVLRFHGVEHKRGWTGGSYLTKECTEECIKILQSKLTVLRRLSKRL